MISKPDNSLTGNNRQNNTGLVEKISGLIGALLVSTFVIGLAESITSGFAGFWGGLPFWVISISVLLLTFYDYWDSCFRK